MEVPRQDPSPMRRGGPRGGPRGGQRVVPKEPRTVVEHIREATGASVDIIQHALLECKGDVNRATEQLIDAPFKTVRSKKSKTTRPSTRGGRRGSAYDHAGGRSRPAGQATTRGRGGPSRGTSGPRTKYGGRGRAETAEKNLAETGMNGTGAAVAVAEEQEEPEVKTKPVTPPRPVRKAYLEALCGKPKAVEDSGFLVQKMDQLTSFPSSGWETASSPPETLLPAFHGPQSTNEMQSEEEKVDSVATVKDEGVKEEVKSWPDEVERLEEEDPEPAEVPPVQEAPAVDVFPFPMKDIRFTRPDSTPVIPCQMPMPMKIESSFEKMPNLDEVQLDMSTIEYLFGTFAGLVASQPEPEPQPVIQHIVPVPVPEQMPIQEETASSLMEETDLPERLESTSLNPEPTSAPPVDVESRLQGLPRSSVEFLSAPMDTTPPPPQLTAENFAPSNSADYRLDMAAAPIVEVPLPPSVEEKSILTSTKAPVEEEPVKVTRQHLLGTEPSRSDKPFSNPVASLQDKPQSIPALDEPSDFAKASYQDSFVPASAVENPKKEELSSFDVVETRPAPVPHRPPPVTATKPPAMEPVPSFGMPSGPAPSLPIPTYQSQRHAVQTHKLPDKPVPTQVGSAVASHQQPSKYNAHPTAGGITPGQNPNAAVHVPTSLNPNNSSGNQSMPLMPQVPFISPGMVPNPAIPFHAANPYYPHLMQYQHQMYHGMYTAGTYGSFGAPFNHESVGHPAHASPVGKPLPTPGFHEMMPPPGVPPNQGTTVYETNNPSSFSTNKEKDNVFLNQQQLPHAGFPGGPQAVPRNEAGIFYSLHGQPPFSQGFRSQFHQPPGFNGQFPGGGFVAPPHTYHPTGQGSNLSRFH